MHRTERIHRDSLFVTRPRDSRKTSNYLSIGRYRLCKKLQSICLFLLLAFSVMLWQTKRSRATPIPWSSAEGCSIAARSRRLRCRFRRVMGGLSEFRWKQFMKWTGTCTSQTGKTLFIANAKNFLSIPSSYDFSLRSYVGEFKNFWGILPRTLQSDKCLTRIRIGIDINSPIGFVRSNRPCWKLLQATKLCWRQFS